MTVRRPIRHSVQATILPPAAVLVALAALVPAPAPGQSPSSKSPRVVALPQPPMRIADAAVQAQACIECHEEIAELLEGDKHIARDFHCVVCHGPSKPHLEQEVEGTLPDRVWRRWIEEENGFRWRREHAPLEIARFCASCHGRKPGPGETIKTIDWKDFLKTGHGLAIRDDSHDAPTCTDCHYAHGAGCEPFTDATVVERCSICHGDREMMARAGVDPHVMEEFQAGTHGDMATASARQKSSCIRCHEPH